jgi:hypothetical protein
MRFNLLAWVVLIGTLIASLAVAYELNFGGKVVVADKRMGVFNTEYAAAYEGALNRVPIPPIVSIESGEPVAVIWDTYGKDYWACYVRTSKGVRGWALCTSLTMVS